MLVIWLNSRRGTAEVRLEKYARPCEVRKDAGTTGKTDIEGDEGAQGGEEGEGDLGCNCGMGEAGVRRTWSEGEGWRCDCVGVEGVAFGGEGYIEKVYEGREV